MHFNKRTAVMALTASASLALSVALVTAPASAKGSDDLAEQLVKEVETKNLMDHLRAFQQVAEDSGNYDRAGGTSGYDASLEYIKAELDAVGYDTTVQPFPFAYTEELKESFREISPNPRDIPVDVMTYSGASPEGGVTALLTALPVADATPGCEAATSPASRRARSP